jgi:hypothetical protein
MRIIGEANNFLLRMHLAIPQHYDLADKLDVNKACIKEEINYQ